MVFALGVSQKRSTTSNMQLDPERVRQRLEPLFRENFEKFGELGAAVSIWQDGKPVVDLYGGFCDTRHEKPWEAGTLVLVWSATKGIGSACLLHVLQEHKVDISTPVAEFWPEFAQSGKEKITLAQLVSHQAVFARWISESTYSTTNAVIRHLKRRNRCGPRGAHMVITLARLDSCWMNSSDGSREKRSRGIGAKCLPSRLISIFGLVCRKKKIHALATIYAAKSGNPPEPKNRDPFGLLS